MNMILHNITRFTIENGDTLEDPLIFENGQIRKFDRVLANPPFSQNYSRANMKFTNRFREWCPETGKKADLMFVQHMLASLKPNGRLATIMPHGVLFRGGKEKLIRELFIDDDCIEAIVSLPPRLFYGTGIPACVLVCNKSKPDSLKDKIFFINADREYAEGKNQNQLRPEDIEKIDFVFTHKRELPKYSRFVSKTEIVNTHNYNLNIRRYVDNTPDPEPQDVQAHLIGGIPDLEVDALSGEFAKFGINSTLLFKPKRSTYHAFHDFIEKKLTITSILEDDPAVLDTLTRHNDALASWWAVAKDNFTHLQHAGNNGKKMPEIRNELLTTLNAMLTPLGVFDEFKSAGIFVNWWQQIRYDLKTIASIGWHHTLIPDDYFIAEYFQSEANSLHMFEAIISQAQGEMVEAIKTAQEVSGYESDEDKKISCTAIKKVLKSLIDDLKDSTSASARKELKILNDQDMIIKSIEKRIRKAKATLKKETTALELKLELKRFGADDFKADIHTQIAQTDGHIAELDPKEKDDKRAIAALENDKKVLNTRLVQTDALLKLIDGQINEADAHCLILKKIFDIARAELDRYLIAEKRVLVRLVENLWEKYTIATYELEDQRTKTLTKMSKFLTDLGYME